jgi:hypothetical protein
MLAQQAARDDQPALRAGAPAAEYKQATGEHHGCHKPVENDCCFTKELPNVLVGFDTGAPRLHMTLHVPMKLEIKGSWESSAMQSGLCWVASNVMRHSNGAVSDLQRCTRRSDACGNAQRRVVTMR